MNQELNIAKQKLDNLELQKTEMEIKLMKLKCEIKEQRCLITKLKKENSLKEKIYVNTDQIENSQQQISEEQLEDLIFQHNQNKKPKKSGRPKKIAN